MTSEEIELTIIYLEGMKEEYIEGEGYERHPLPEYFAIEMAIKALEQQNKLFKAGLLKDCESCKEDFRRYLDSKESCEDAINRQAVIQHICEEKFCYVENCKGDIYKRCPDIMWVYDLPSVNPQKSKTEVIDKIRAEIEQNAYPIVGRFNNIEKGMTLYGILQVIDKYKAEMDGEET